MILTDKAILKMKPNGKRVQCYDRKQTGLVLRVEPSGRKAFFFMVMIGGKRYTKGLGDYPSTSLPKARDKAHDLSDEVKKWIDAKFTTPGPFAKVEPPKPEP